MMKWYSHDAASIHHVHGFLHIHHLMIYLQISRVTWKSARPKNLTCHLKRLGYINMAKSSPTSTNRCSYLQIFGDCSLTPRSWPVCVNEALRWRPICVLVHGWGLNLRRKKRQRHSVSWWNEDLARSFLHDALRKEWKGIEKMKHEQWWKMQQILRAIWRCGNQVIFWDSNFLSMKTSMTKKNQRCKLTPCRPHFQAPAAAQCILSSMGPSLIARVYEEFPEFSKVTKKGSTVKSKGYWWLLPLLLVVVLFL